MGVFLNTSKERKGKQKGTEVGVKNAKPMQYDMNQTSSSLGVDSGFRFVSILGWRIGGNAGLLICSELMCPSQQRTRPHFTGIAFCKGIPVNYLVKQHFVLPVMLWQGTKHFPRGRGVERSVMCIWWTLGKSGAFAIQLWVRASPSPLQTGHTCCVL